MKVDAIRELTLDELEQQLKDSKAELFNLKFQLATGQLDNALKVRFVRRDIARVSTVIRQREMNPELEPKKRAEPKKTKTKAKPKAASAKASAPAEKKPAGKRAAAGTSAKKSVQKKAAVKKSTAAAKAPAKKASAKADKDKK